MFTFAKIRIELESQLDQWFSDDQITATQLQKQIQRIGETKAHLRFVHLSAHLQQKTILTPHQIHQYIRLRGYNSDKHQHNHS